ncbi:MAG: Crp/Fnr family transcriptional regulator [Clostridia bacterium]|nr:Crp/Fnr family transcriptional regulator [Clostridia bacterium]
MKNSSLFLLKGLTKDQLELCQRLAQTEEQNYCKGDTIYTPQTAKRALAMVMEGHVRVFHGHVPTNDLVEGDVFGAAALFGTDEEYPSTIVAESDCRVMFIPQETVVLWMKEVPQVAENYVGFLSDRIRFLNRRLATLTAGQADGKLWRYLLAHRDEDGVIFVEEGMSALAERLDMGRSSLYRSLDALALAGRIRRDRKKIYILQTEE